MTMHAAAVVRLYCGLGAFGLLVYILLRSEQNKATVALAEHFGINHGGRFKSEYDMAEPKAGPRHCHTR